MTNAVKSGFWFLAAGAAALTHLRVFALLFRVADWPAPAALLVALVTAARQTFLLSRFRAFRS